jgi:spoIIIJ-associated protein
LNVASEYSGRTVHEAVDVAVKELGLERDELVVEVLQEPRPALLGFGGREARVRVSRKPDASDVLGQFAATALRYMGFTVEAHVSGTPEATNIEITGEDLDVLVDSQGKNLDAIELLLGIHAQRQGIQRTPIVVDAAGYRAQHEKGLVDAARAAADRAAEANEPVRMDPMGPRDRRVVHMALKDDARVHTVSEGEDDARRVVVLPGAPSTSSADPK